jgi:hypothetical protein
MHLNIVRSLTDEYETAICSISEKLDQAKASFEIEKVKIEQDALDQMTRLKADLDATLAEKGELQKEVFDKVEAHEQKLILQKSIDNLNSTLTELKSEKETLLGHIKKEQDEVLKVTDLNRLTEATMQETNRQL